MNQTMLLGMQTFRLDCFQNQMNRKKIQGRTQENHARLLNRILKKALADGSRKQQNYHHQNRNQVHK